MPCEKCSDDTKRKPEPFGFWQNNVACRGKPVSLPTRVPCHQLRLGSSALHVIEKLENLQGIET